MTYSVDEVQLPGMAHEVVKRQGVGVGVEGERSLDHQVENHETLGTQLVRQNLNGVTDEKTGPGDGVEDTKEPDEEDHGVVGAGSIVLIVQARGEGPEDEGAEHTRRGGKEHGTAADLVDEQRHRDGNEEGQAGLAGRETELLGRVRDAGGIVQDAGIVGNDGVTRPLGEETERKQDDEAVTVALGPEEVQVAAACAGLELEAESLLDLLELKLDGSVVLVTVGVVLGKHLEGNIVPVLGDVETGRLGHPVDEGALDDGGQGLEQGRNTPRPLAGDEVGAEGDPGDGQGTDVPQAVVDGGETSTMLGMGDLGEKHWRANLRQRVAETEQNTAAGKHAVAVGSTLDGGTSNHDGAANGDGELTAKTIGEDRAAHGTNG